MTVQFKVTQKTPGLLCLGFFAAILFGTSLVLIPGFTPAVAQTPAVGESAKTDDAINGAARKILRADSLAGAELPYRVFLPAGYEKGNARYPVLYLLHGYTGNEDDWWKSSRLSDYLAKYRLIVVTPGVGDTWYANSATDPHARYEDVIVRDLIPCIDRNYRTIAGRKGRAIAGLSMGGLGAIKFALRYPDMFAFAGSFSGAFGVPPTARLYKNPSAKLLAALEAVYGAPNSTTRNENDVFWLLERAKHIGSLPYLFLAAGANDPLPQATEPNQRFAAALAQRQAKYEFHLDPGAHDWKFWDTEIQVMLAKLALRMPAINAKH